MYQTASKANPYQSWIDTYASDSFEDSLKRIIHIFDFYCCDIEECLTQEIEKSFEKSMRFEYSFWVEAYEKNFNTEFEGSL